jgi:hypothetical protein
MEAMTLSMSAALDAIREAMGARPESDDDALLCWEIADAIGLSISQTSRYLRQFVREGRLEVVRKRVPTVEGVMKPQPAYRLKAPAATARRG